MELWDEHGLEVPVIDAGDRWLQPLNVYATKVAHVVRPGFFAGRWASVIAAAISAGLIALASKSLHHGPRHGPWPVRLAIVAATWMVIAHLSAIPYMWSQLGYVDALFETKW